MSHETWDPEDPDLRRAREIVLSILRLDTSSPEGDDQSTLRSAGLSDDFMLELEAAPEKLKHMAAWSAIILLDVSVLWIDRLTGMGTDEVVATLSKTFRKPSNGD
jgi:hypothetical protein